MAPRSIFELAGELARKGGERIGRLFAWRACIQRMVNGFASGGRSDARRGE